MAKVLITGAAGFIGCNLSNWLMQHSAHQLVGIDNMTTFSNLTNLETVYQSRRYSFHVADVCDAHIIERIFRLEKPNYVIHAAGNSERAASFDAVAQAVEKYPVERLLVLNYADKRGTIADWPRDIGKGSGVRMGLEQEVVWRTAENAVAVNLCDLYGPREAPTQLIPNVIKRFLDQKEVDPADFDVNIKEWMYIKDAFLAICALMKYSRPGHIYNITAGYKASDREMLYKIASIMGVELPQLEWEVPAYTPILNEDCGQLVSTRSLGWYSVHDFEESLEHTICWYNANRWAFEQELVENE